MKLIGCEIKGVRWLSLGHVPVPPGCLSKAPLSFTLNALYKHPLRQLLLIHYPKIFSPRYNSKKAFGSLRSTYPCQALLSTMYKLKLCDLGRYLATVSSVFSIWPLCFVSEITPAADEGVVDSCTNYIPQSLAGVMKFTLWSQGKNMRRTCCIHFISVSIQDQNILFQISIPLGATQHQKIPQIRGFQASNSLPAEQVSRWYRFSEEVVHFFLYVICLDVFFWWLNVF